MKARSLLMALLLAICGLPAGPSRAADCASSSTSATYFATAGVAATVVNGVPVIVGGEPTGALPGEVVRPGEAP